MVGFALSLISVLFFLSAQINSSEISTDLRWVSLFHDGETFKLNEDARCQVNEKFGILLERDHEKVWSKLVADIRIITLTQELVRFQLIEQMNKTGLVTNSDPSILTSLQLGFVSSERKIQISNLDTRRKSYPNASALTRLYKASQLLSTLAELCKIGDEKINTGLLKHS